MSNGTNDRIEYWQQKSTKGRNKGDWHKGKPSDYRKVERLRIGYTIGGKRKYYTMRRWPDKPGLTAAQQTEFIEDVLPEINQYAEVNG